MRKTVAFVVIFLGLALAGTALAGNGNLEFAEIAPLPTTNGGVATDGTSLGDYINTLFGLALSVGAVMAVIFIGIGGFEYMMSESVTAKSAGRTRIMAALYGLIILLVIYLVIFVINPEILNLDLFRDRGGYTPVP